MAESGQNCPMLVADDKRTGLIGELASSLAFLHSHGICVGDISPKNLLFALGSQEAVYFVDCDTMQVNGKSALPQVETPGWEVPAGEPLATVHSDAYKLGLLALRLFVGDQDTSDTHDLPIHLPDQLRRLITDALSPDPVNRPLPQAWSYLLPRLKGGAITPRNKTPQAVPTRPATQRPTSPPPVLRSRPPETTSRPRVFSPINARTASAGNPSPSSASAGVGQAKAPIPGLKIAGLVIAAIVIALIVQGIVSGMSGDSGSNSSQSTSTTSRVSSTTTTTTTTTQSLSPEDQTTLVIRTAAAGDCLHKELGPPRGDGTFAVTVYPAVCGSSWATHVVSKRVSSTYDCPSEDWVQNPGPPPVALCLEVDTHEG